MASLDTKRLRNASLRGLVRKKSNKKRNEIILRATELFIQHGYSATSMAAISAALGGSKSTLYRYFATKELLFSAFVFESGKNYQQAILDLPLHKDGIEETLIELGEKYLRLRCSKEVVAVSRVVTNEAGRFPELGKLFYDNGPSLVMATIEKILISANDRGLLKIDDPTTASWQFKALCESDIYDQILWGFKNDLSEQNLQMHAKVACNAFLKIYATTNQQRMGK